MAVEVERKYLVEALPPDLRLGEGVPMRQGYLAAEGDVETRLRITPAGAVLTVKAGGGLVRAEVEVDLADDDAEQLWPFTEGRRISKIRHEVPLADGSIAEVDVYHEALDGLCTVEVEFDSVDAATRFAAPSWFGRDLTGDKAWSNSALARHGLPPSPS